MEWEQSSFGRERREEEISVYHPLSIKPCVSSLHDYFTYHTLWIDQHWVQSLYLQHFSNCFCRQTGKALTFVTREDWRSARALCTVLADSGQVCSIA